MAMLEEIIKTEKSRSDSRAFSQIHLFKERVFLRAYEQEKYFQQMKSLLGFNRQRNW